MTKAANSYYDVQIGEVITVAFLDMDPGINEQVTKNSDGSFTIFLNARSSEDQQREGFDHARGHILRNDWEKCSVQQIEAAAHGLPVEEDDRARRLIAAVREEARKERRRAAARRRRAEKRREALEQFGLYEEEVVTDGEYGEPVVKTTIRKR